MLGKLNFAAIHINRIIDWMNGRQVSMVKFARMNSDLVSEGCRREIAGSPVPLKKVETNLDFETSRHSMHDRSSHRQP